MVLHFVGLVNFAVNKINVLVQVTFLIEFHVTLVKMACIWLLLRVDTQMGVELA